MKTPGFSILKIVITPKVITLGDDLNLRVMTFA